MGEAEGVSIARLQEQVRELRDDVIVLTNEERRTRTRLHQVEGLTGMLVDDGKQRRREEQRRSQLLARRLNVLTAAIALAALFEPFLYHLATGR